MLNFAEQTGSGAVIVVWSFLSYRSPLCYITIYDKIHSNHQNSLKNSTHQNLLKTHTLPPSTVPINLTSSECKISKKNSHHKLYPLGTLFVIIFCSILSKTVSYSLLSVKHLSDESKINTNAVR